MLPATKPKYLKSLILITGLLFSIPSAEGQKDWKFYFDEFLLSINQTTVQNSNTENRIGFGFGGYHTYRADKMTNLILGVEFNRVNQFKNYETAKLSYRTNVKHTTNYLSVPLSFRVNFGTKIKFRLEGGGFVDLNIGGKSQGIRHNYHFGSDDDSFTIQGAFTTKGGLPTTLGFSGGIGISIPTSLFGFVIKVDYKHGLSDETINSTYEEFRNRYCRLAVGIRLN